MNLKRQLPRLLCVFVSVALFMQLLGCGYIFYPERRGQRGGTIDVGIAVLDGLGLLLFIIPGVVAFAVDFSTGAIYYPPGKKSSASTTGEVAVIQVNPEELNEQTICDTVQKYAGCSKRFRLSEAKMVALNGTEEIGKKLEEAVRSGYRAD